MTESAAPGTQDQTGYSHREDASKVNVIHVRPKAELPSSAQFTEGSLTPVHKKVQRKFNSLKVCLTQRGMLPLKHGNIIVYSDGVSHKLWQSKRDMLHTIMLQKTQDVTRSPTATAERSQSATCALKLCPKK